MDELTSLRHEVAALRAEVARVAARGDIRAVLAEYMHLCDRLDETVSMQALGALFTRDALWEGRGSRNGSAFGRHQGRAAIVAFLDAYRDPPHFLLNVHYLTSETIEVDTDGLGAAGSWVMLQLSTVRSGVSTLVGARLQLRFAIEDGRWRIALFQTTNLFSRAVATPWEQSLAIPVPPASSSS